MWNNSEQSAGAGISTLYNQLFCGSFVVLIGLTGTALMVSNWFARVGNAICLFRPGNPA